MSILALPRISFIGKTEWNPDTTNNYRRHYNATDAAPVPPTDDRPTYMANIEAKVSSDGNWNLYGDHAVRFVETTINSIQLPGGAVTNDPLLNRPTNILGLLWNDGQNAPARLVDVNPYGSTSSQIFFDSIQIGDSQVGVTCKRVDRFSDRDFSLRNLNFDNQAMIAGQMGVVWQTAFPKDQLTWSGLESSPALAALKSAVEAADAAGLVVRFVSYRTQYFTNCSFNGQPITTFDELSAAYKQGFKGKNPAYSALLGDVGVWKAETIASGPNNRVLIPVGSAPVQGAPNATPAAATAASPAKSDPRLSKTQTSNVAAAAASDTPTTYFLGLTQFLVETDPNADSGQVVLDFINTVPEINQALVKANFGSFQVQARSASGQVIPIGSPISYAGYDQQAYESGGGILTVPFTRGASVLSSGTLELVTVADPTNVLLAEQALNVVTDSKSIYLDEGQNTAVRLCVLDRGEVTSDPSLQIAIFQYFSTTSSIDPAGPAFRLTDATGAPLPVDANSVYTIPVQAGYAIFYVAPNKPGVGALSYQVSPLGQTPTFDTSLDTGGSFSNIRNLPWDDSLAQYDQPGVTIPWNIVYENILKVYDLVYPVMSLVIDLHNKQAVDGAVVQFRAATAMEIFQSTLFMPITREMSERKRNVLWRYLQQVEMGG